MSNRRGVSEGSGATMREIAEACEVSHTAVSFVLRGRTDMAIGAATRQRIFEQAIISNYRPQRHSRLDAARLKVLYLCPDLRQLYADVSLPGRVMVDLVEREREANIRFEMVSFERSRILEYLYRGLCEDPADAVIVSRLGDQELDTIIRLSPVPVINLGHNHPAKCDEVSNDNVEVGRLIADYFWENGHRRPAIFSVVDMDGALLREKGFRDQWQLLGGDPDDIPIFRGHFTPSSGRQMLAQFEALPKPRPTAIFAASDSIAYGAIQALWDRGYKVPDEVSLAGCDDLPYSPWCNPSLSSIQLDSGAMADVIIEYVLHRCGDEEQKPPQVATLPVTLVKRRSVRRLSVD